MSTIIIETVTNEVEVTVAELARAFWDLCGDEQAAFFDELGKVIEEDHRTNSAAYRYGELQWYHLKEELRRPGMERANSVHMAMSAFAFDFVDQKANGCRE